MADLTAEMLREAIRTMDPSDPFALVDLERYRTQLRDLEKASQRKEGQCPASPHTDRSATSKPSTPSRRRQSTLGSKGVNPSNLESGRPSLNQPGSSDRNPPTARRSRWYRMRDTCERHLAVSFLSPQQRTALSKIIILINQVMTFELGKDLTDLESEIISIVEGDSGVKEVLLPANRAKQEGSVRHVWRSNHQKPYKRTGRRADTRVGQFVPSQAQASRGGFPPGASMASYQRLPSLGHGRSFEDSLALRQSSRQVRRQSVDRVDRAVATGSYEDMQDVDD